jgi:hypothetical protein
MHFQKGHWSAGKSTKFTSFVFIGERFPRVTTSPNRVGRVEMHGLRTYP